MMQFHEWFTLRDRIAQVSKGIASTKEFLNILVREEDPSTRIQAATELDWVNSHRPYYSLYPIAAEAITRVKLDVQWKHISLPLTPILLRTAKGHEIPTGDGRYVRSVLIRDTGIRDIKHARWLCWVDMGESVSIGKQIVLDSSILFIHGLDDWTVEESINEINSANARERNDLNLYETESIDYGLIIGRLLAGVAMLANDPDFVVPEILSGDEAKLEKDPSILDRLVDKACRRGKIGWSFGKAYESTPHLRRPHLGLRWCGEGRKIPRIVPIKGSIVHKQKLSQIPTGKLDQEIKP